MAEVFLYQGELKLGEEVRVSRTIRRLRQVDLAHEVGVAQTEVSRLERGKNLRPSAERRILRYLGLIGDGIKHYEGLVKAYACIPAVRKYFERRLRCLRNGEGQRFYD